MSRDRAQVREAREQKCSRRRWCLQLKYLLFYYTKPGVETEQEKKRGIGCAAAMYAQQASGPVRV